MTTWNVVREKRQDARGKRSLDTGCGCNIKDDDEITVRSIVTERQFTVAFSFLVLYCLSVTFLPFNWVDKMLCQ